MASPVTVIRPKKLFRLSDLSEIWDYRELLYFFSWRDLKVRYKQTFIGAAWAIIQPFMTMIIFSVVFGSLAKVPSDGVPYPIFVYTGLLLWQFFSTALSDTAMVLTTNQPIITKVYFPRLVLPIASVATKFVDFGFASIIMAGMMVYYHFVPHLSSLIVIPIALLITFTASVGGGLFLAAMNVKYRDVRYILPFFIQILMYVTPVIYPAGIAGKYSWILALNPMTGAIQATRAALLGTTPINWTELGLAAILSCIALVIGVVVFKKTERYFADVL